MLDWLYYILLLVVLIAGWLLNILGVPGLWLMLIGHIAFAWITGWGNYVGWPSVIALFVLALVAEIVEFVAGAAGSAQAGGTKRGMMGAIVGGIAGFAIGLRLPRGLEGVDPIDPDLLALLSPAREQVLWAEVPFWVGTVFGIAAIVLGILAIRNRSRRGFGIAGLVLAVLGPFIYGGVLMTTLPFGVAAGFIP